MGTATQNPGGPLLGTNIPPGMSYNAGTGAWTFSGALTSIGNITGGGGSANATVSAGNGTAAGAYLVANATAGSQRGVLWRSVGVNRWLMQANSTLETGGDAGSNFSLDCFADGGAAIDSPLSVTRVAAGQMTLGGTTRRTLATTGGRVRAFDIVTDTVTLNSTHNVVVCNKGTAMTVNLPAVASNAGREYIIKNKGAGVVTVDANASELIDSATTQTLNQWQSTHLVCDGTIWVIV